MAKTKDRFEFGIAVRGEQLDPEQISRTLAVPTNLALRLSAPPGYVKCWVGVVEQGAGEEEWKSGLEQTASFLIKNDSFFHECATTGREVELIVRIAALASTFEGDKVLELTLFPKLLLILSSLKIALRVEGWHWT